MAVVTESKGKGELKLIINNGDFDKMEQVIKQWHFKDEQAFLRFCISALLVSDENKIGIMEKGSLIPIVPADHSIGS